MVDIIAGVCICLVVGFSAGFFAHAAAYAPPGPGLMALVTLATLAILLLIGVELVVEGEHEMRRHARARKR